MIPLKKKIYSSKGFTLLEVMITLTIFSIGILGVAKMQLSATSGNTSSRGVTEAASYGQQQIESLMALSLTSLPSTNPLLMDTDGDGTDQDADDDGIDDGGNNFGLDDTGAASDNSITVDTVYNLFWNIAVDEPIAGAMRIRLIVQWKSSGFGNKELVFDTIKVSM